MLKRPAGGAERPNTWEQRASTLEKWVRKHKGKQPKRTARNEEERGLARWVNNQRTKKNLSHEQRERLGQIPGWSFDDRAHSWDNSLRSYISFVEDTGGHAKLAGGSKKERRLAKWLKNQRYQKNLSDEQRERLNEIDHWNESECHQKWQRNLHWLSASPGEQHGELARWVRRQQEAARGSAGRKHLSKYQYHSLRDDDIVEFHEDHITWKIAFEALEQWGHEKEGLPSYIEGQLHPTAGWVPVGKWFAWRLHALKSRAIAGRIRGKTWFRLPSGLCTPETKMSLSGWLRSTEMKAIEAHDPVGAGGWMFAEKAASLQKWMSSRTPGKGTCGQCGFPLFDLRCVFGVVDPVESQCRLCDALPGTSVVESGRRPEKFCCHSPECSGAAYTADRFDAAQLTEWLEQQHFDSIRCKDCQEFVCKGPGCFGKAHRRKAFHAEHLAEWLEQKQFHSIRCQSCEASMAAWRAECHARAEALEMADEAVEDGLVPQEPFWRPPHG